MREALAGTPGRMRVVAVLAVVVTLGFGLGAGQAFRSASGALERARADAAQVVRVQDIHTDLVQADAAATNAFLVGGLEPAGQRATYDAAVADASARITGAARAQPADGEALGRRQRRAWSATPQAWSRPGPTTGRACRSGRSTSPRPAPACGPPAARYPARRHRHANRERVQHELDAAKRALLWLVLPGLLALLVLAGAMLWMAVRTHRYVNLPLAGATLAVLVGLVAGWVVLAGVASRVDEVRDGPYAAALATAQARVAGFDAKAQESLTLIKRGSGGDLREGLADARPTQATSDAARRASGRSPARTCGGRLRRRARRRCAGSTTAASGSRRWPPRPHRAAPARPAPTRPFKAFDRATHDLLVSTSGEASARLAAPGGWLVLAGALGLLLGLLAAAASWWGVSQRLQEYR